LHPSDHDVNKQDYAISIATIHHLSTHTRRLLAVQRLIQSISPTYGRALIYVWAVEQDDLSKRKIPSVNQPSESVYEGQDVFVPWVLATQQSGDRKPPSPPSSNADAHSARKSPPENDTPKVFNRYYHMFAKGELRMLVEEAAGALGLIIGDGTKPNLIMGERGHQDGVEIVQDGWERSNYYIELRRWRDS